MRRGARAAAILAAAIASASVGASQAAADPAAAERQYRVAQRLGADRSPGAEAAYERVVALAPHGPLADDALVDLARLRGAPDWPEDLGTVDPTRVAQAREPLSKVLEAYGDGDRALEARYRLALTRMGPFAGRDPARARQDLTAVASTPSRACWVADARYALGVLDEGEGLPDRAAGSFARVVVEQPDCDVAPRARVGYARTLLAEASFGAAAGWLQDAVEAGAPPADRAEALRALALAELVRERVSSRRWSASRAKLSAIATARGAALLATAADGGVAVFNRKSGALETFDAAGAAGRRAAVAEVTAIATDPYGRIFAATKDALLRWDAGGLTTLASLTGFASPSAIAADASGAVWIADRKGERIARWTPGLGAPVLVRDAKGSGVTALVALGARVIAAEEKTGRLFALDAAGTASDFTHETFRRPIALSVDAADRVSVLDAKADTVTRLDARGEAIDTLALGPAGVSHALALAAAPDGAVRILDGATGAVAVAR